MRINLWSGPRNVSTALMYSFRQRGDTTVVDEPLYSHYLTTIADRSEHPGTAAIVASMSTDARRVAEEVILAAGERPVRFYKQMAHHLVPGVPPEVLTECRNVLLVRDPVEVLSTIVAQLPSPVMRDIGIARQVALYDELVSLCQDVPVLDARLLLLDPPGVLGQLCERLGIDWDEAMLSWPPGPKPEDGVWAPDWYHNAHRSTAFGAYHPKSEPVAPHLRDLADEATSLYEQLLVHALR